MAGTPRGLREAADPGRTRPRPVLMLSPPRSAAGSSGGLGGWGQRAAGASADVYQGGVYTRRHQCPSGSTCLRQRRTQQCRDPSGQRGTTRGNWRRRFSPRAEGVSPTGNDRYGILQGDMAAAPLRHPLVVCDECKFFIILHVFFGKVPLGVGGSPDNEADGDIVVPSKYGKIAHHIPRFSGIERYCT